MFKADMAHLAHPMTRWPTPWPTHQQHVTDAIKAKGAVAIARHCSSLCCHQSGGTAGLWNAMLGTLNQVYGIG